MQTPARCSLPTNYASNRMASIKPLEGKWRAQVYVLGTRASAVFRTKREAEAWASAKETEIRASALAAKTSKHTVLEALRKYASEVSVKKRGGRWEVVRLEAFENMPEFPADAILADVTTTHLAEWRDARMKEVKASTVLREISLLSALFETARREWKWIVINPFVDLRKPKSPEHRDVVIDWRTIRAMLKALQWAPGPCCSTTQAVGRAFMLALRTGMRAGEICKLTWGNVRSDYCILPETKTRPRHVPLTREAAKLIASMSGWDDTTVFGVSAATLDATFRRVRKKAGLSGFTFHDSRHTAATRMALQLDVLTLCKVFGWQNTSQALTYYNPTASEIATRLAAQRRSAQ